jgi:mono/diheme cytochrome c family protein
MKVLKVSSAALILAVALATGCNQKEQASSDTQDTQAATSTEAVPEMSGQQIFETRCSFCHGPKGLGDTPVAAGYHAANLKDGQWVYGGTKNEVIRTITMGVPGTPMRGFGGIMSPAEIDRAADYVLSLPNQK